MSAAVWGAAQGLSIRHGFSRPCRQSGQGRHLCRNDRPYDAQLHRSGIGVVTSGLRPHRTMPPRRGLATGKIGGATKMPSLAGLARPSRRGEFPGTGVEFQNPCQNHLSYPRTRIFSSKFGFPTFGRAKRGFLRRSLISGNAPGDFRRRSLISGSASGDFRRRFLISGNASGDFR